MRESGTSIFDVQEKLERGFPELSPVEVRRLAGGARLCVYSKGKWIFSEGNGVLSVDWLISGRVELLKSSMNGRNSILHVVGPEHFLELCSLFGSGTSFLSALALSPCTVLRMDSRPFRSVLEGNAAFAGRIMKALAVRQRMYINKIAVSQGKISVRRRVAGWLLHKARVEKSAVLDDGITREVLAGLLGLSRESLSRQLSRFVQEKVIRLERKAIVIMDEKALRRCLED